MSVGDGDGVQVDNSLWNPQRPWVTHDVSYAAISIIVKINLPGHISLQGWFSSSLEDRKQNSDLFRKQIPHATADYIGRHDGYEPGQYMLLFQDPAAIASGS